MLADVVAGRAATYWSQRLIRSIVYSLSSIAPLSMHAQLGPHKHIAESHINRQLPIRALDRIGRHHFIRFSFSATAESCR